MIQRIQTIYLFLASLACLLCLCLCIGTFSVDDNIDAVRLYNLCLVGDNGVESFACAPLFVVLALTVALGIYTIFLYGNRKVQARFCLFSVMLLLGWYALYAVCAVAFTIGSFTVEWPFALPFVAIVFFLLARRGILADERLVKAADRIR